MIKLWPSYSGIDLNNEVAYLFFYTKNKFSNNLLNCAKYKLYTDILSLRGKKILFHSLLAELEILILDIVELDLSPNSIKSLSYKIVCDLVSKSQKRFLKNLIKGIFINEVEISHNFIMDEYVNLVLLEYSVILQDLLIYLIFGSSVNPTSIAYFKSNNIPRSYISVLLESSIIRLGDLVIYMVLDACSNLSNVFTFLSKYQLCNTSYLSIRSLACFKNSLSYQHTLYLYIDYPKNIYNCRYRVFLMSSQGIISKYIYSSRFRDISTLSSCQFFTIFCIELQDFILPSFERNLLIVGKFIVYILVNLFANFFIIIIKIVAARLYIKNI